MGTREAASRKMHSRTRPARRQESPFPGRDPGWQQRQQDIKDGVLLLFSFVFPLDDRGAPPHPLREERQVPAARIGAPVANRVDRERAYALIESCWLRARIRIHV